MITMLRTILVLKVIITLNSSLLVLFSIEEPHSSGIGYELLTDEGFEEFL